MRLVIAVPVIVAAILFLLLISMEMNLTSRSPGAGLFHLKADYSASTIKARRSFCAKVELGGSATRGEHINTGTSLSACALPCCPDPPPLCPAVCSE